jgi:hypothetical protein
MPTASSSCAVHLPGAQYHEKGLSLRLRHLFHGEPSRHAGARLICTRDFQSRLYASRLSSGRLAFGASLEKNRCLKMVPAAFAGPQMSNASFVHVLRPVRSHQRFTALRTGIEVPWPGGSWSGCRIKGHLQASQNRRPYPRRTLVAVCGVGMTAS